MVLRLIVTISGSETVFYIGHDDRNNHIDCCDLSVLDFKRGRLKFAIGLQCDETGQSIDETGTNQFRAMLPEKIRQRLMDFHDGIEPENRLHGRRTLAAAVRMNTDIGRQHRQSAFMSPLRDAVKKASASSRPRCLSTWKRGLASRT